jgi:hypothetical protein
MQRFNMLKVGGVYGNHSASLYTAVIGIVSLRLVHWDSVAGRDGDCLGQVDCKDYDHWFRRWSPTFRSNLLPPYSDGSELCLGIR